MNYCTLLFFLLINLTIQAQSWGSLLDGTDWQINDLYADTLTGQLYLSGRFEQAGMTEVNGIARWDGTQFHSLGDGVDYCITSCPTVRSVIQFQDEVYCSPTGFSIGGIEPNGMAKIGAQ